MICKTVEIRDAATFIVALAIKLESTNESDRYLLARAGYGLTPERQAEYVFLVRVEGGNGKATCDPYDWNSSTMLYAHDWLIAHFDEIPSGAVIDVEFLMGKKPAPKRSEAEDAKP